MKHQLNQLDEKRRGEALDRQNSRCLIVAAIIAVAIILWAGITAP